MGMLTNAYNEIKKGKTFTKFDLWEWLKENPDDVESLVGMIVSMLPHIMINHSNFGNHTIVIIKSDCPPIIFFNIGDVKYHLDIEQLNTISIKLREKDVELTKFNHVFVRVNAEFVKYNTTKILLSKLEVFKDKEVVRDNLKTSVGLLRVEWGNNDE